jgi:hypothetical protein
MEQQRKQPGRLFDHIDLRVPRLADVQLFYETLLPALGFTRNVSDDEWLQFEAESADGGVTQFFGVTQCPEHIPNGSRIAFWVEDESEVVRIGDILRRLAARNIEGPMEYEPDYHAVFFEDPCGNRLEVCHRKRKPTA